jgi:hypothetical protein
MAEMIYQNQILERNIEDVFSYCAQFLDIHTLKRMAISR